MIFRSTSSFSTLSVIFFGAVCACGSGAKTEPSAATPAAATTAAPSAAAAGAASAKAEAEQIFSMRCTPCHGAQGHGDGPASAGLTPKPRNFTDVTWQGQVTDDHLEQIIQYGGAAVGKSPAMPPNPDLMSKPEVVAALRQHIRSLKP